MSGKRCSSRRRLREIQAHLFAVQIAREVEQVSFHTRRHRLGLECGSHANIGDSPPDLSVDCGLRNIHSGFRDRSFNPQVQVGGRDTDRMLPRPSPGTTCPVTANGRPSSRVTSSKSPAASASANAAGRDNFTVYLNRGKDFQGVAKLDPQFTQACGVAFTIFAERKILSDHQIVHSQVSAQA